MPFDEKCKKWRGSDILKKYANEEKPLLNKRLYRTEIYCQLIGMSILERKLVI